MTSSDLITSAKPLLLSKVTSRCQAAMSLGEESVHHTAGRLRSGPGGGRPPGRCLPVNSVQEECIGGGNAHGKAQGHASQEVIFAPCGVRRLSPLGCRKQWAVSTERWARLGPPGLREPAQTACWPWVSLQGSVSVVARQGGHSSLDPTAGPSPSESDESCKPTHPQNPSMHNQNFGLQSGAPENLFP